MAYTTALLLLVESEIAEVPNDTNRNSYFICQPECGVQIHSVAIPH